MPKDCALAGIDVEKTPVLSAAIRIAGMHVPIVTRLSVTELGKLSPMLLVCDLDALEVDPLEMLRQLRFVLPGCTIAVYTNNIDERWAAVCHLAGANCLLSKESTEAELANGIRVAVRSGCFTDPSFAFVDRERLRSR